jgi:hypothetical protein
MSWLLYNWKDALGVLWLVAIFFAAFYFHHHPEQSGARIVFFLVPFANPNPRRPPRPGRRAVILWLFGLFIVLMAVLFVPGFI